jgi:hypothetical protein
MISTLHAPVSSMGLALLLVGCAGNPGDGTRQGPQGPAQLPATQQPRITAGASGGFGNATQPPLAGSAAPMMPGPRPSCQGGQYAGKYRCDLEVFGIPASLEGEVSFLLEIDQTVAPSNCQEFCPGLVIAEGSGTLFGLAGDTGWAFEAKLDGGLDCRTGEFRATAPKGIYGLAGSNDPNDPNALSSVLAPPLGEFEGKLSGMHNGPPERIAGDWDLVDAAELARCSGPFTVELQP